MITKNMMRKKMTKKKTTKTEFHEGHEPQMGYDHYIEEESDRHREDTYDAWANEPENLSESDVYE